MTAGDFIAAVKAVRIEGMLADWKPQVQAIQRGAHLVEVCLVMAARLPGGDRIFDGRETVRLDGFPEEPGARALGVVRGLLDQAARAIIHECVNG